MATDSARRMDRSRCLLLIIDVQERLTPHVLDHENLVSRCEALLAASSLLGIPRLATEHCPSQIGPLVARLRSRVATAEIFEKTFFGALEHAGFSSLLAGTGRQQIVVAGMETHVCVLQTVLGLVDAGLHVFLVADATGSRATRQADRRYALHRMLAAGCTLVGTETVLFEWTRAADDAAFAPMLALVKSLPPSCELSNVARGDVNHPR